MSEPNVTTEGSEGSEVTYVNGKAVEQETSGETPDGDHGAELAAAKEAVRKALAEEGKKAAKEAKDHLDKDPLQKAAGTASRGPDGKFVAQDGEASETGTGAKTAAPEEDDEAERDASALRKALNERKAQAKFRAEAAAQLERERQEARQVHQQYQRELQAIQAERERLQMLRKDPIKAIRENGWDPEQFILDIASDGTPEGQARRQQRELQQQLQELADWKRQQAEEAQHRQRQQEQQQRQQFRGRVEQEFLRTAGAVKEDGAHMNPHLVAMYKDDPGSLVAQADLVADRYRAATGKEATFAEITEYLEERAERWYKSISKGAPKGSAPVTKGQPAQGSPGKAPPAGSKRTITPNGSSERRTLGTNISDLDGDERLEAAREAVRAAIHASGER